jgi:hypothetical protein
VDQAVEGGVGGHGHFLKGGFDGDDDFFLPIVGGAGLLGVKEEAVFLGELGAGSLLEATNAAADHKVHDGFPLDLCSFFRHDCFDFKAATVFFAQCVALG